MTPYFIYLKEYRINVAHITSYAFTDSLIDIRTVDGKVYQIHYKNKLEVLSVVHKLDQLTAPINLVP